MAHRRSLTTPLTHHIQLSQITNSIGILLAIWCTNPKCTNTWDLRLILDQLVQNRPLPLFGKLSSFGIGVISHQTSSLQLTILKRFAEFHNITSHLWPYNRKLDR